MTKIVILLLSLVVAVESGFLVYGLSSGKFGAKDAEGKSADAAAESKDVPSGIRIEQGSNEMIDELLAALKVARKEVEDERLSLEKRRENIQELQGAYLKLRDVVEVMQDKLDSQLVKVDENERKNCAVLAGVYSQMDPASAARALKNMTPERVAIILTQMDDRGMASILDSAATMFSDGGELVSSWSDSIRRMMLEEGGGL